MSTSVWIRRSAACRADAGIAAGRIAGRIAGWRRAWNTGRRFGRAGCRRFTRWQRTGGRASSSAGLPGGRRAQQAVPAAAHWSSEQAEFPAVGGWCWRQRGPGGWNSRRCSRWCRRCRSGRWHSGRNSGWCRRYFRPGGRRSRWHGRRQRPDRQRRRSEWRRRRRDAGGSARRRWHRGRHARLLVRHWQRRGSAAATDRASAR